MLEFLIDSILVDLSLYSYEAEFIQNNDQRQKITEAKSPNLTFVYIDDILSINDPHFTNWIPLIYPPNN
jgi:hypothetical protein